MSRRRHKKLPLDPVSAQVTSVSHEGRGVAQVNNKKTFIEGALPGEHVLFKYKKCRSRFDEGIAVEINNPSPERVTARCKHFEICGGCNQQHIDPQAQIEHKQSVLVEQLKHIGNVQPAEILSPLTGPVWGYRNKARLGVKYVEKKQKLLVGFREKFSPFIADIQQCEVLNPKIGTLLEALQELIGSLTIYNKLPQIEVAVAESATALVIRHLVTPAEGDLEKLKNFSGKHDIDFYMQPGGIDTVVPLIPGNTTPLTYSLPDHSVVIEFSPTEFTQVNFAINRLMVNRAIEMLALEETDRVLDLFCGLGNFSLPVAKKVAHVTGVEGDEGLVNRARFNAELNKISNVEFKKLNLADPVLLKGLLKNDTNKILIDPPRTGAQELISNLDFKEVDRIVYVSCNPATLARDAGILVNEKGFSLQQTGVIDMFPHTAHVESIALFEC